MKVIIERVNTSSVTINNKLYNKIDKGLLIFVGFTYGDNLEDIDYIVKKIVNLRIFNDEAGIMNKSILDIKGSILSISNFTLYANTKKGNRPSYINALKSDESIKLYNIFNTKLNKLITTKIGIFGEEMTVNSECDGPITIVIDSKNK